MFGPTSSRLASTGKSNRNYLNMFLTLKLKQIHMLPKKQVLTNTHASKPKIQKIPHRIISLIINITKSTHLFIVFNTLSKMNIWIFIWFYRSIYEWIDRTYGVGDGVANQVSRNLFARNFSYSRCRSVMNTKNILFHKSIEKFRIIYLLPARRIKQPKYGCDKNTRTLAYN